MDEWLLLVMIMAVNLLCDGFDERIDGIMEMDEVDVSWLLLDDGDSEKDDNGGGGCVG